MKSDDLEITETNGVDNNMRFLYSRLLLATGKSDPIYFKDWNYSRNMHFIILITNKHVGPETLHVETRRCF